MPFGKAITAIEPGVIQVGEGAFAYAGCSDPAQLDPLAAEDDIKDVSTAALEPLHGGALQLRSIADAENAQGRVVAREREDVSAVEQRHQAKLAAERERTQRAVAADVAPHGLLVAEIRAPRRPVDGDLDRVALHVLTGALRQKPPPVLLAPLEPEGPRRALAGGGEHAVRHNREHTGLVVLPVLVAHTIAQLGPRGATGRIAAEQPAGNPVELGLRCRVPHADHE